MPNDQELNYHIAQFDRQEIFLKDSRHASARQI